MSKISELIPERMDRGAEMSYAERSRQGEIAAQNLANAIGCTNKQLGFLAAQYEKAKYLELFADFPKGNDGRPDPYDVLAYLENADMELLKKMVGVSIKEYEAENESI